MNTRIRLILFTLNVVAVMLAVGSAYAQQHKVLLIHSYDETLTWTRQCNLGIEEVLSDDVELKIVYLDSKRLHEPALHEKVAQAYQFFREFSPDVVMLGDDNALRFLGSPIAATGVQVVYFGINNNPRHYFQTLPPNVFGVIERVPLMHWVRMLAEILPAAERFLVLMDNSPTARALYDANFRGRNTISFEGKTIDYAMAETWQAWQWEVVKHNYDCLVTPVFHSLKDDGAHISYDEVIRWTSKHSRAPVFTTQDYAVGDQGAVGALVVFGEEHGRSAGRIVNNVLNDNLKGAIPTADDQKGKLYFNQRQLDRYGISLPLSIHEQVIFK